MSGREGGRGLRAGGTARLFGREELCLRRTGTARLADFAREAARRPASARESREREDRVAIERLRRLGSELAGRFGLRYATIEAERPGIIEHYGICYADGVIRVRLRHAVTGRLLKESSLVDTLCHELAHLRHFDHSPRFQRFYRRILEEARRRGDYRPGPPRETRCRQASLFSPSESRAGGPGGSR